jgi:hypothetical protein
MNNAIHDFNIINVKIISEGTEASGTGTNIKGYS